MTKKYEQFQKERPYFKLNLSPEEIFHYKMGKNDLFITVETVTNKDNELVINNCYYYLRDGDSHPLVDAFLALIQKRAVDIIDRVNVKELDYFLRDDPATQSFSQYEDQLFHLIGLGEFLKKKILGKEVVEEKIYEPQIHGLNFFELSLSEQYELLEEIFSRYIYKIDSALYGCIEIEEITVEKISLSLGTKISESIIQEIKKRIREYTRRNIEIEIL